MNTNTLKAALVEFTGKKLVVTDEQTFRKVMSQAPAISQDSMNVGEDGAIVTRAYGGGDEAYKVDLVGEDAKFFKLA